MSSTGQVTGSLEGEAIAFLQVDALCRGVLDPKKMASVFWEMDLAQGPCGYFFSSPLSLKTQSLFTQLWSTLPVSLELRVSGCE